MRNICLDLNIILDVLLKREPFFDDSYRILNMIQQGRLVWYIPAHHIDTLVYIIRRNNISEHQSRFIVQKLSQGFSILTVDAHVIRNAIADSSLQDIEDAITYYASLSADIDCIVTRDATDFPQSNDVIQILTPEDFRL